MQDDSERQIPSADIIETISNELALVMFRHKMDLKKLSEFISENSQQIVIEWTKKLRHRDYLAYRKIIRREVLRRHWIGIPYRTICEALDVSMSRAPEIKAMEMDRIWKLYRKDPSLVHEIAEEYKLAVRDIVAIYENRQERWEQNEELSQRRQEERDAEFEELIGYNNGA